MTELATTQDPTPMQMLAVMVNDKTADPDRIKALMDLHHTWEIRQAQAGYAEALAQFQGDCPPIRKLKAADRYKYAPLEDIMRVIKPHLQAARLSVSFSCEAQEGALVTTCYIQHGIHREEHKTTLPIPEMRVNDTQKWGAAMTYGKRYALTAALNIVIEDEDCDARNLEPLETITEVEAIALAEGIDSVGVTAEQFCEAYSIAEIGDLPRAKHTHAKDRIKKREQGAAP